jgi:meiotically up-regulated gene 157 (Mug157) protein
MIRQNIDAPVSSRKPDFHITPEIRAQLLRISGRQTDRVLKLVKDSECLRGISGTKTARETLLKQIPVRTRYSEDEAKTPGFCQTDTDGW